MNPRQRFCVSLAWMVLLPSGAFQHSANVHRRVVHAVLSASDGESNELPSADVSDLGLTMDDLNEALPPEFFGFTGNGYESTSRIESVVDDGCEWTETAEDVLATLQIPGLRGQPAGAMAVTFSSTTMSVSVFGRIVWSAILRGKIDPEASQFGVAEGEDMVPIIRTTVRKESSEGRWGGLILQIGEDSIL